MDDLELLGNVLELAATSSGEPLPNIQKIFRQVDDLKSANMGVFVF